MFTSFSPSLAITAYLFPASLAGPSVDLKQSSLGSHIVKNCGLFHTCNQEDFSKWSPLTWLILFMFASLGGVWIMHSIMKSSPSAKTMEILEWSWTDLCICHAILIQYQVAESSASNAFPWGIVLRMHFRMYLFSHSPDLSLFPQPQYIMHILPTYWLLS